ncbi:MAG: hypothetical protein NC078_01160 [Ruminococcus sp.]|nr:hypothetical protein [Ruminococcus sp.]
MERVHKGIMLARDILLIIACCTAVAETVLMIVGHAVGRKYYRGYVRIKDSDEMPF